MTLDGLAAMVKRGFDQMSTKDDLKGLATKNDLKDIWDEMSTVHADVRYIRSTVDVLIRSEAGQDAAIQDLTSRVHRLEQKAGLAK